MNKNVLSRLLPFINLIPAALVVVLVVSALPATKPVLREIPELLTIDAQASETKPLEKEEFEEPQGYVDGTYYGSASGFGGTIQVKVVISGGMISDITIVSANSETPSYLSSAKAVISRILAAQSPNVDTISGATYSSTGIVNAVKKALSQAAVVFQFGGRFHNQEG